MRKSQAIDVQESAVLLQDHLTKIKESFDSQIWGDPVPESVFQWTTTEAVPD